MGLSTLGPSSLTIGTRSRMNSKRRNHIGGIKLVGMPIPHRINRVIIKPLKERENFGFEYSGAKDPSCMVPALELTYEEVLERLQKMLKGVSVVLHTILEYCANNPPPTVSCFLMWVLFVFPLLSPLFA